MAFSACLQTHDSSPDEQSFFAKTRRVNRPVRKRSGKGFLVNVAEVGSEVSALHSAHLGQ